MLGLGVFKINLLKLVSSVCKCKDSFWSPALKLNSSIETGAKSSEYFIFSSEAILQTMKRHKLKIVHYKKHLNKTWFRGNLRAKKTLEPKSNSTAKHTSMLWEMVKDKTSEIGTKVEYDDNGDLAHNAITSKVKMDADHLTDFG